MNELATYQSNLPATIDDISKFVLVGREKLTSVRAEIRAISKLNLAQEVRDQKFDEARMLSEALLDAEVKLGELTKAIPRAKNQYQNATDSAVASVPTKYEVIQSLGFTPKQVERFEVLADNKDLVEQVKAEARDNDDIPTRTQVLNLAKYRSDKADRDYSQIGEDAKKHKAFIGMVYTVLKFDFGDGVLESVTRSTEGKVSDDVEDLQKAITILISVKNKLIAKGAKYGRE